MSYGYEIEWGLASGGATTVVDVGGSPSYNLTGLTDDTAYRARVRSYRDPGIGYSLWSAWVEVRTLANDVSVLTHTVTEITLNGARLNGELYGLGDELGVWVFFRYGPTTSYGFETSKQFLLYPANYNRIISGLTEGTEYHFRAVAQSQSGSPPDEWLSDDATFTALSAFTIETDDATGVDDDSATLNGELTDIGSASAVNVYFNLMYKVGTSYVLVKRTDNQELTAAGTFDTEVTGLFLGTQYSVFAMAEADGFVVEGNEIIFTTAAGIVQTDDASNITSDAARLNGDLLSMSEEASIDVWFDYGLNFEYSSTPQALSAIGTFYEDISGLDENKEYVVRAVATDGVKTWYGEGKIFVTSFDCIVKTLTPSAITTDKATLEGVINLGLDEAVYYFEYGTSRAYGTTTPETTILTTESANELVSWEITGLTEGTEYYYRLVVKDEATDPDSYYYGNNIIFSTAVTKTLLSNVAGRWLFEIEGESIYWSTMSTTFDSENYSAVVIPDTFDGIESNLDLGSGLISSPDLNFDISNADGSLDSEGITDAFLQDKIIKISLIVDGSLSRAWKYKIIRVTHQYGSIRCYCKSLLQTYLTGDWPNTEHPKSIWPSSDTDINDTYCEPIVFGNAFIPIMSVNTGTDRHYALGKEGPTYTIEKVRAPHERGDSEWDSGFYTFTQSTDSGHQLVDLLIYDNGVDYDPGFWKEGDSFLSPFVKYSRSDTVDITNPAQWIEWILKDMGVPSSSLDIGPGSSFEAAKVIYHVRGMVWGGGFWEKQSREEVLAELLSLCDSYLYESDKIELHPFSRTSREFFDKTIGRTFSPTPTIALQSDGGKVVWPNADSPQDVFPGKTNVNISPILTEPEYPQAEPFEYWVQPSSIDAQIAGVLHFQKLNTKNRVSFTTSILDMLNFSTLRPGQVVTLYNPATFKMTAGVVITSMKIEYDLKVGIDAVELTFMNEWGDLSPSAVTIVSDTTEGNMD